MSTEPVATHSPWARLGLGASLLLNVLLLGIIAGHVFTADRVERRSAGALVPRAQFRALPADERSRFAAAMASHHDAIRMARQAHRRARLATEADIGAPELNAAKLKADLAALRQANEALQAATNEGLVEALSTLSPPSRAALVAHGKGGS